MPMSRPLPRLMTAVAAFGLALLAACTTGPDASGPDGGAPPGSEPMADFSLPDVNPTSASFETSVSPRSRQGKVSAWYFGHST